DHPESEIVLAGIEDDRVRLVRHQLLKVQIRESHRVGAWTSARRKTQDSTELPGMLALQICELLLERVTRNDAAGLIFSRESGHARIGNSLHPSPARYRLSLVGIHHIPKLVDPRQKVHVVACARKRGPWTTREGVVQTDAPRAAGEHQWVQWIYG